MVLTKQGNFTFNHADQQDDLYKAQSAAEVKADFDSRAEELKVTLNALIDALNATTGANDIGVTAIAGLTGSNVQSLIESLKSIVDGKADSTAIYTIAQLLSTTIGSSGADLINSSPISGVAGTTVREILQDLKYQINGAVTGSIPDGSITQEKLAFEIATDAGSVSIADTGSHFNATNVEEALDELFTSANSVKTNVSGAIGSPATVSDTGSQLAGYITTQKGRIASEAGDGTSADALTYLVDRLIVRSDDIATQVNAKGVPATSADTLAQLATKVGQIGGTAVASDILSTKTATTNTGKLTGTMPNRGTFNLALGASVPAGYYSGGTVPSGMKSATGSITSFSSALTFTLSNSSTQSFGYVQLNLTSIGFIPTYALVKESASDNNQSIYDTRFGDTTKLTLSIGKINGTGITTYSFAKNSVVTDNSTFLRIPINNWSTLHDFIVFG